MSGGRGFFFRETGAPCKKTPARCVDFVAGGCLSGRRHVKRFSILLHFYDFLDSVISMNVLPCEEVQAIRPSLAMDLVLLVGTVED